MTFDFAAHTIFVTLAGSYAHGTARAGSDLDLRGVCVAPLELRLSLFRGFEQDESPIEGELWTKVLPRIEAHPTASRGLATRAESVIFDLAKFISLAATANPNALELLFTDESDWLLETPAWRRLHRERHAFLSQKVQQTYLGYAMAQLKRIKTHRSWLLHPPTTRPSRADFGLPDAGTLGHDDRNRLEQSLAETVQSYGIDSLDMPKASRIAVQERLQRFWIDQLACSEEELSTRMRALASHSLKLPSDIVATLNAERKYLAAVKHWDSYQTWKTERNPARAELERRHGYDTKHAMHLIRLMRIGLEVLETGELLVRRPDAAELIAIRDGALSYDQLLETATALQSRMQRAAQSSTLPVDVDRDRLDALAFELVREPH